MAKAKSTSTKKVAKKSIADAAKETYLKSHTKEQMYKAYDDLHKLQNKLAASNIMLETELFDIKGIAENLNESVTSYRNSLNDANLQIAKLKLDLKDAKQHGKLFGMLSAAMFLAFVLAVLIN